MMANATRIMTWTTVLACLAVMVFMMAPTLDADEGQADTAIHGSDKDVDPTTTFIIGTEYDNVFIGYGADPGDALEGMTVVAKEIDGRNKMFISGTPTAHQGLLLPFNAGSTAYLALEAIPGDEGYGAEPSVNGLHYYFEIGQEYDYVLCIMNYEQSITDLVAPEGMHYEEGENDGGSLFELVIMGVPTTVQEVSLVDADGDKIYVHVVESGSSSTKPTSITISPASAELAVGSSRKLTAIVNPESASQAITWTTSDSSKVTVNQSGRITAKAVGTATVKAISAIDDTVFGSSTITVKATAPAPTVSSIAIEGPSSVKIGSTIALSAIVNMSDGTSYTGAISWSTAASSKATVSSSGVVKGVSAGTVDITATAGGKSDTKTITVTEDSTPVQTNFDYSFWVWAGNGYTKQSDGQTSGNVELTVPNAPSGYTFKGWARYTSAQSFATIQTSGTTFTGSTTINSDSWFYAVYTKNTDPVQQYTISVVASPSDGGTVSGGGTYDSGRTVTLTANANSGYTFSGWSDNVSSATRTVTVSENRTYTAVFTYQSNPVESKRTVNFAISDASLGNINITISAPSLATTAGNTLSVPSGTTVSNNNGTLVFTYNGTEVAKAWVTATNGNFSGWSIPTSVVQIDGTTFTATMAAEQFDWEEFLHQNAMMLVGAVLIIIIGLLIVTRL